jgi:hypothetical protein
MLEIFKIISESETNGMLETKINNIINDELYNDNPFMYNEEALNAAITHNIINKVNRLNNNINIAKTYVNGKNNGFTSEQHNKSTVQYGLNKLKNINNEVNALNKEIYRNINNKNISVSDGNRLISKINQTKEKAETLARIAERKKLGLDL